MSEPGRPAASGTEESRAAQRKPKGKKKPSKKVPAAGQQPEQQVSAARAVKEPGHYKYNHEDRTVVDYVREATKKNIWYYRDRMSVPRGPCTLPVLKEAWVHGVIDETTLVWGQGLQDWLPVRNVRTLVPQIRTAEVRLATWVKRIGLGWHLDSIRKQRPEHRVNKSSQVDGMF